ncbi:hypothetical protein C0033_04780 [Clostridium sp. chh4-2]|uniref:Wadjet anti-phage system protein JetA family protein n=1 Tax=Clostridium sp. chh4-2 TaxID=2067550 RepID=UPI000CCE4C31|nr:Wadjet anti-phage system protein JetA family protein [Clostridium sp. chh4-2]PNV63393.1 hypothetical protein C0033_04780 [Clostridium sp. chh4-2]
MRLINEIPDRFWSLFRSVNRETYIEALLKLNEEYEYNSYFLSREVCIQVLADYFAQRKITIKQEEEEDEIDALEPPATRILNWLVRAGWLRKLDDYNTLVTNIVIPDYAAIFIEAFEHLFNEEENETEVYIQNIYAILFSFKNDPRASVSLLHTALVNTRKLNKALQDMLHNMDKFFASLLEKRFYGDLLKEHLEGYVEEIVKKKYHILKTSDNFYLYKTDIKRWINEMREDYDWMEQTASRSQGSVDELQLVRTLDDIERGFDEIERRIANMDREHMKYVSATVGRLNYLLNNDDDTKGLVIQLLNHMAYEEDISDSLSRISSRMNLSALEVISEKSLYKKRKPRIDFTEGLEDMEESKELTREDILRLNRLGSRYSKKEIEDFIFERMTSGTAQITDDTVQSDQDFEKLILAYDYAIRRNSAFAVKEEDGDLIDNGRYKYPKLTFTRK